MISDFGLPGTLSGTVAFICLTKYSNQSQIGFPKTQIFSFTHLSWLQTFQGNQKQTKCIWWKVRIKWQEMNDWYPSTNLQVLKSIANMVVPFKNIISIACTKHALKTDEKNMREEWDQTWWMGGYIMLMQMWQSSSSCTPLLEEIPGLPIEAVPDFVDGTFWTSVFEFDLL